MKCTKLVLGTINRAFLLVLNMDNIFNSNLKTNIFHIHIIALLNSLIPLKDNIIYQEGDNFLFPMVLVSRCLKVLLLTFASIRGFYRSIGRCHLLTERLGPVFARSA